MIELPVYNREGAEVGKVEIDEADFGGEIRHRLLRDVILMYEAAQRVGTASTKTRAEVHASHTKPWRQKGTGRARAGFKRSPLWRGGGIVFGPKPRDYRYALPRKAVQAARRSAFLAKFKGATTVVDRLVADKPCTRDLASTLKAIRVNRTCLIAIEAYDANLWKSARNLPHVSMKPVAEVNAYDLLLHPRLVITRAALERLIASARGNAVQADAAPAADTNE